MNYTAFIASKVRRGREATISLALLERNIHPEVPALRAIEYWAKDICRELNCTASIHIASDVVTFYPARREQ